MLCLDMDPNLHFASQDDAGLTKKFESSFLGSATLQKPSISPSILDKNPMPEHLFECKPVDEVTTRRGTDTPVASSGKTHRFQIQVDKWPVTP